MSKFMVAALAAVVLSGCGEPESQSTSWIGGTLAEKVEFRFPGSVIALKAKPTRMRKQAGTGSLKKLTGSLRDGLFGSLRTYIPTTKRQAMTWLSFGTGSEEQTQLRNASPRIATSSAVSASGSNPTTLTLRSTS